MSARFGRRQFLEGIGAAAALSPFVPTMHSLAQTSDGGEPHRFVVVFFPNGAPVNRWVPSGSRLNWTPSPILNSLGSHLDRVHVFDQVDWKTFEDNPVPNDHGPPAQTMLSANVGDSGDPYYAKSPSLETVMGAGLGSGLDYEVVRLGARTTGMGADQPICYAASGSPVRVQDNPAQAFSDLFAAHMNPGGGMQVDQAARARGQSVLDLVKGDLDRIRGRLDCRDRDKMEVHLNHVRTIERRLGSSAGNVVVPDSSFHDGEAHPLTRDAKKMADMLVSALGAGMTRVGMLQLSQLSSVEGFSFTRSNQVHHGLDHHTDTGQSTQDDIEDLADIAGYYMGLVKYLLDEMSAYPLASGGTLADKTSVLVVSEHSRGPNMDGSGAAFSHWRFRVPHLVIGNPGGKFKHASQLYDVKANGGVGNGNLFLTLLHAFGLDQHTHFGHGMYDKVLSDVLA